MMFRVVELAVVASVVALAAGCGGDSVPGAAPDDIVLELNPAGGTQARTGDTYVCLGFAIPQLPGRTIRSVRWSVPGGTPSLHHATVFATGEPQASVASCDSMPADAIALNVWVPGSSDLDLGPDTGLIVPAGHGHLLVELHLLSVERAVSAPAKVTISLQTRTPLHVASWLGIGAPVPAIRPLQRETSTSTCRLANTVHLLMTWPHMHRAGLEFHGAVVDGGVRIPIVDVVPWDVGLPGTRSLDIDVSPGSIVETTCVWQNRTNAYVLPGRSAADEMCVQGLIGYPFEAMRCDPSGT